MKIAVIMGTRPEIIKLYPIISKLNKKNSTLIFTGQHYDFNLSQKFIKELGIRKPDFSMKISKNNPAKQIREIIIKLSKILTTVKPETVLVQGDTNTVLAASLAAQKCKIPLSHVEAGLRSFDWRMPEEFNRIVADHTSKFLFTPTTQTKKNLNAEKVHGRIFVTGNTVIDSINHFADISSKKAKISIDLDNFILLTLHRSENVDDKKSLLSIINGIIKSKENFIFPIHPRTVKKLKLFGIYKKILQSSNIHLIEPVGYFDMIELMKKCSFIVSDSGGIQEEATSPKIRKKVLILRKTTDRPEAIESGFAELVGTNSKKINFAIKKNVNHPITPSRISPYGKGDSANKIIKILQDTL